MKPLRTLRNLFSLGIALTIAATSNAQSMSLGEAINGTKHPAMLGLAALTDDYRAMRLTVSGSNSDALGAILPMSMLSSPENRSPMGDMVSLLGTSWSTGETTRIAGHEFLITYKLELALGQGAKAPVSVALRLCLVRTDLISSISPLPDITRATLEQALKSSNLPLNDAKAMAIPEGTAGTAAVLMPVFSQAKAAAKRTASLSRVKQAGLALMIYMSDYDDVFPYAQSTGAVVKVTEPYSKNHEIWWSSEGNRFLFNMSLAGVSQVTIDDPAGTVMLYEEKPDAEGYRAVAFADGHAKSLKEEEWQSRYAPKLRQTYERTAKRPLPVSLGSEYNGPMPTIKEGPAEPPKK